MSDELEEIRKRKLAEYQAALMRRLEEEKKRREKEELIRRLSLLTFTKEARQRLANLKLVKPELAEKLETTLISLAQQGRLETPITDEQLKRLLSRLSRQKKEIRIRRL